jgi:dipeptidyl aminopeptidase/acylaminoacyl peptidase
MTFEDMMNMKRLGETAVSPDGKWLAYSVTTVDLAQNTKTAELWLQKIAPSSEKSSEPFKLGVAQPGDSGPQFSPDGHSLLWVSSRENGQQLWLADFDSETGATTNAKKLTNISTGADSPKWSPDSKSIVFTSAVYPDCPAITSSDFATGNQCNAEKDARAASTKVKAQIFTQLLYRHWNHYTGEKRSHLFLLDVASGGVRDLTPNDPHDVPPFSLSDSSCGCDFSPDSIELAFTENPDPVPAISISAQIYTLDLSDPSSKPRKISTSAGGNFNPAYSPDGKYIAWRSEERAGYESDKFRLMLYDREQGSKGAREQAGAVRDLLPKFDNWVDEFAWGLDSKGVYFAAGDSGSSPVLYKSLDGSVFGNLSPFPSAKERTTRVSGSTFADLHILSGTRTLIASAMGVKTPSEVYFLEDFPNGNIDYAHMNKKQEKAWLESGGMGIPVSVKQITHLNDELLSTLDLPDMDDFWFAAADKREVEGFLIPPPGFDPTKKYPVKFLIHGGPEGDWGDAWSYRWNAELFAANGYVVVMINPRGSTGYGQAFVDGVNGDWGGKPFTDLMTGLDYAEEHYPFIDKTRECALGASYGGYMANWILGHTDRFKCIVSHDGMFDAESAFGTTEEDWFNIWEFKGHPWDYYGKPDAENPFRKWSPSLSAKNFKTPTLVVHGQLDYRLDVSEGFQLFDTLQLLGVPSKMLYFPDEGHWVMKPQNSQLWYKTVNDWVDQWTKK